MSSGITFLNAHWMLPIFIGGFILWSVFICKEGFQFKKRNYWIKIAVAFIGIVCLVLMALKPAISKDRKSLKAILLTEGYEQKLLDSLKKEHRKSKVITYSANKSIFKNINLVDSVFVIGQGIEPFDFWQLENIHTNYLKDDSPSGVLRFKYDHKNTVGDSLRFKGLYNHPKEGSKLVLEGPGGIHLDSVYLTADTEQVFQLSTQATTKGKYIFSLVEKDSLGEIRSKDPIPVIIEETHTLKIAIINSSPTFETKYLKNYLTELGHQVLVKSQITKGRYKFEYFNMDRTPLGAFTKKNLESFDLIVIDATSLRNLSKNSRDALEDSVRENGLGIFIQPENFYYTSSSRFGSYSFKREKKTEVTISKWPKKKLSKSSYIFKNELLLQPIHKDSENKIISAYKRIGKGRIGTTVLEDTYELLLNGHTTIYQQLWSDVMGAICNTKTSFTEWETQSFIAYQHYPFEFKLRTSIDQPIIKSTEGYKIPVLGDINLSNIWTGTTYPLQLGWNQLQIEQDSISTYNYYVLDFMNWKAKTAYEKIWENRRFFKKSEIINQRAFSVKPIPLLWFFMLFLVCVGYLWLEPKLSN